MAVAIDEVYRAVDAVAPFSSAYEWDNSGLLIRAGEETAGILIALDLTDEAVDEAIKNRCSLIVAHHPLFFGGIKKIDCRSAEGGRVVRMLQNGISLICAHTNADRHLINAHLAQKLGLMDIRILAESANPYKKTVVFAPEENIDAIVRAACGAGAGHIGNYSHCTFQAGGTGTFLPEEGTNPYIGQKGVLDHVPEVRAEFICPAARIREILRAVKMAHPYEEPAIDVYDLSEPKEVIGTARMGTLERAYGREEFLMLVKKNLGFANLRVSRDGPAHIRSVAVCGGGGASLLHEAAAVGADVFLTGELKHSSYIDAKPGQMLLVEAGHFDTEACFVELVFDSLQRSADALQWNVNVIRATLQRPFIQL